jgi:hypothetical protein
MAKKYLERLREILKGWRKKSASQDVKSQSSKPYSYETIPLKLYLHIANTKDLTPIGNNVELWEQIVKKNSEANNDTTYENYVLTFRQYNRLYKEYLIIKAAIVVLLVNVDKDLIAYLSTMGHRIDTSTNEKYDQSLVLLGKKADNLTSKIKTKVNEIVLMDEGKKEQSFEGVMAMLCASMGFHVPDDITLARYNEYKKILRSKKK